MTEEYDILRCVECGHVFESYMVDEDFCPKCGGECEQLYKQLSFEEEYWENHKEKKVKEEKEK